MLLAWIPITIGAAAIQAVRFALQKHLSGRLSAVGATFVRFAYGAPLAIALVLLLWASGWEIPGLNGRFVAIALGAGLAQILATVLLVASFRLRNFTVGLTLSKTETLMTALLSALMLGEMIGGSALLAIALTVMGVVLMSGLPRPGDWRQGLFGPAALMGLGAGVIFGFSATGYRAATLALDGGAPAVRAAVALAFVTSAQTVGVALWLAWRDRPTLVASFRNWRIASLVGLTSIIGSFGWFTAFALQHAAYVKALGQIELVFAYLLSVRAFKERSSHSERIGMVLVVLGILLLILS